MKFFTAIFFVCIATILQAQFSPAAGVLGSNAIWKNDASVSFWSNEIVSFERGWMDIADTSLGKASLGIDSNALWPSDGITVSLGDAGSIVLSFPYTIANEPGYDFAVFENSFESVPFQDDFYFVELGMVEVSYDGINFFGFETTSFTDTSIQLDPFGFINVREVNNLAGKYVTDYGTPFDLEEIGLDSIKYIRVTDVVGSITDSIANYDSDGRAINDPYPTPFVSCGFDLDAIAALNQKNSTTSINTLTTNNVKVFPNPVKHQGFLQVELEDNAEFEYLISSLDGKVVSQGVSMKDLSINTSGWSKAAYLVKLKVNAKTYHELVLVQ